MLDNDMILIYVDSIDSSFYCCVGLGLLHSLPPISSHTHYTLSPLKMENHAILYDVLQFKATHEILIPPI